MAFRVLQELPTHFVVHDGAAPFRVAKAPLSPRMLAKVRQAHIGGEIVHEAEGGEIPAPTEVSNPAMPPASPPDPPSFVAKLLGVPASTAEQRLHDWQQGVQPSPGANVADLPIPELGGVTANDLAERSGNPRLDVSTFGGPTTPAPSGAGILARPTEEPAQQPPADPLQTLIATIPPRPAKEAPITGMGDLNRAVKEQKAGIQATADVQGKIATANVGIQDYFLRQAETNRAAYDAQMKANQDRIQAMQSDILANKIDPNRFWETRSTGQKIAASIGMLLSGAGSAVAGQPNYAMQVINDSINRDIAAQKSNLQTKQNILRTYMEQGHNIQDAYALTKADLLQMTSAQTLRVANQYGGQAAQAQAQTAAGQLDQQAVGLRSQVTQNFYATQNAKAELAMRQATMTAMAQFMNAPQGGAPAPGTGTGTTGGLRGGVRLDPRILPFLPEQQKNSIINLDDGTYAMARTPKDADEVNNLMEETRHFQDSLSAYKQLFQAHPHGISSTLSPEDYGKAKALHAELLGGANKIGKLQRLTDTEIEHVYNPMIPDITDVSMQSGQPAAMLGELQNQVSSRNWSAARTRLMTRLPGMP